jgi:hypothetical protein
MPHVTRKEEDMEARQETLSLVLDESLADVERLIAAAEDYERKSEELAQKAQAIRLIVDGVQALNGDAKTILTRRSFVAHGTAFETRPLDPKGPRGRKAVMIVMSEHPDRVWKVVDVKREMLRRGWAPTPKAVEATIAGMRTAGLLEPVGYGHYKLASNPAKERDAA